MSRAATVPEPAPQVFDPLPGSTTARIEDGLARMVTACLRHEPRAPAAIAFRLAVRRLGGEALAAGGTAALAYLARRLAAAEPDEADARAAVLDAAWADLPGWRP